MLAEVTRVHAHLAGAERLARQRGRRLRLEPARRLARALLLDELARYRRARRYPQNHDFRGHLAPVFVDAEGTRCAVAHLLEVGGEGELVQQIARERNFARVRELANDRRLLAFLDAAGLTLEEAARIQPSYCFRTPAYDCFCGVLHPSTIIEGTITARIDDDLATVHVDHVHGTPGPYTEGAETPAHAQGGAGTQVLLMPGSKPAGGATELFTEWPVSNGALVCESPADAASHPVPTSVAIDALLAGDSSQCEAALAKYDAYWSESPCDDGCGCRMIPTGSPAPSTATLAILAAVLTYRRARAWRRRPGR